MKQLWVANNFMVRSPGIPAVADQYMIDWVYETVLRGPRARAVTR
jgi:hypothetical protein